MPMKGIAVHTGCQMTAKMCHPCDNLKDTATGAPNVLNESTLNGLYGLKGNLQAPIFSVYYGLKIVSNIPAIQSSLFQAVEMYEF